MRKPFEGNFPISQTFGNKLFLKNAKDIEYDVYAQWGLNGHNGIDYACPSGTPILAPHHGTVIEANFDSGGYGNYIKIENDNEGSVLAHLDSIRVQIGFEVKEGDIIGISDNTGASTGPHLHWGYFQKPRNRQNGFDGYMDQLPILNPAMVIPPIEDGREYTTDELKRMGINHNEVTQPQTVNGITFKLEDNKHGGRFLHVVKPVVLTPVVTSKMYTEGEYLTLQKERDDALAMLKTEHDNYIEFHTKYSAFAALGYNEATDVTNTIREYEIKLDGVKKQLTTQLKQNADLALIIANKNTEDTTAIEEGIKLGHELTEVKDHLKKISKEVGTNPENIFDILQHIKNIKTMAVKAFTKGREEYKKGLVDANKQKEQVNNINSKSSISSGVEWLVDFLFGTKEVKNT